MDDLALARAVHVLALIHWIGGVAMVTTSILPALRRNVDIAASLETFEAVERAFSQQAKVSVGLVGLSGAYMAHRLDAWSRFVDPTAWWMGAMILVWSVFAFVLYIAEPWFLRAWFDRLAASQPQRAFAVVGRAHWALLGATAIAAGGALLGVRGALG